MTAALYVAIGSAIAAGLWRRPDDRALFAALRAALWVGWLHAVTGAGGPTRTALLQAAWFAALVWAAPPAHRAARGYAAAVVWPLLGVALQRALGGGGAGQAAGVASAGAAVAASASGYWLYRAMRSSAGLPGRMALHWVSFAGTFAYLVPWQIYRHAARGSGAPDIDVAHAATWADPSTIAAIALAAASIALAAWATRAFARAGGTPEPLDAPARLADSGPFARVRNPIQLAEIGLVAAAALWWRHPFTLAYAAAFAAVMVGPMRWYEERQLARRFGAPYLHYRRATPAYLPARRAGGAALVRRIDEHGSSTPAGRIN